MYEHKTQDRRVKEYGELAQSCDLYAVRDLFHRLGIPVTIRKVPNDEEADYVIALQQSRRRPPLPRVEFSEYDPFIEFAFDIYGRFLHVYLGAR